jgi:lipoteichoic acid synthase
VKFSPGPRAALSLLRSGVRLAYQRPAWKFAIEAALLLMLLRACSMLLARPARSMLRSWSSPVAALPLAMLWIVPVPGYVYTFVDRPLYENFIECNHDFFVRNTFSDAFRARILASPPPVETEVPGRRRRLNVILVIVESLSAYQSRYFSGIEDWTPRLDGIARQETALTNFYANGWDTTGGVVCLLTRAVPFVAELRGSRAATFVPDGGTYFTDYLDVPHALPRVLSQQGYSTEFVAAGRVRLWGQDTWLSNVGFQKIVADDDPRFAGQKLRGPFNCVLDRALYPVALG